MSKRNSYLIDSKVQWALIRRLMMQWSLMVLSLISMGVIVQLCYGESGTSFTDAVRKSFGAQAPLLVMMLMLMPVYLHDVMKLSHRFAGPMHRLRTILKSLANGGHGSKLKFRPGDFWQATADDFNRFYEKHIELQKRCVMLEKQVQELQAEKHGQKPTIAEQTV